MCGLNKSATPLVVSGNVSKDASRYEWLGYKSFDRDDKGRLTRGIKGFADNDNNVYGVCLRMSVSVSISISIGISIGISISISISVSVSISCMLR